MSIEPAPASPNGSPPSRVVRRCLGSVLLGLALVCLTSCIGGDSGDDSDGAGSELRSDGATEEVAYSMAVQTIDAMVETTAAEDRIVAVVVPSDRALLALDADRLAELAGQGGLGSLIIRLRQSEDVDLSSPAAIDGAEESVFGSDGTAHVLRAIGPAPTFAGQPIRTIERRGDLTVIVIDGIIEP